jgi:predicted 3-demethylubiquinone-9 3-methyltransferase (glyoxalase superfamily)
MKIQKVTPFLWFNDNGKEAAEYYVSIFKDSKISSSNTMVTVFELEGLRIMILNGGPVYKLNEAFSLCINCENQEEIDYYWSKLSEGGSEGQCGWLKDKFGLSWQVVPTVLAELMNDPLRAEAVTRVFLNMKKFDIEKLKQA